MWSYSTSHCHCLSLARNFQRHADLTVTIVRQKAYCATYIYIYRERERERERELSSNCVWSEARLRSVTLWFLGHWSLHLLTAMRPCVCNCRCSCVCLWMRTWTEWCPSRSSPRTRFRPYWMPVIDSFQSSTNVRASAFVPTWNPVGACADRKKMAGKR